jgi:hypothetical protein
MPGFDGTGPRGLGSLTGRGLGYCVTPVSGFPPQYWGYGRFGGGWGRGRGRGWRNRYWATGIPPGYGPELTANEDIGLLMEEATRLEQELKLIRQEIEQLKQTDKAEKK